MPNLVGIFVKCFTSLHKSTNLGQECNKFLHLFWLFFLCYHYISPSPFLLNLINFYLCFTSLHMSTKLGQECNKFLHLFDCFSLLPLYIVNSALVYLIVLHHFVFICQKTLVTSVTSFYICSECNYYHTTIYSKFCRWSTFLFGRINLAKFSWYFCEMFYITSLVNKP